MSQPMGFLARVRCRVCNKTVLTENPTVGFVDITGCKCCPEDHDHVAVSNGCPGAGHTVDTTPLDDGTFRVTPVEGAGHAGAPCPHEDPTFGCGVTPAGIECPGGHCGYGVEGCTVCPATHLAIDILSLGAPTSMTQGA
jgi:hypothetical protein